MLSSHDLIDTPPVKDYGSAAREATSGTATESELKRSQVAHVRQQFWGATLTPARGPSPTARSPTTLGGWMSNDVLDSIEVTGIITVGSPRGRSCSGEWVNDGGYNLTDAKGQNCGFIAATDILKADAQLGPLRKQRRSHSDHGTESY